MFVFYIFIYLVAVLVFISLFKAAGKENRFEGEIK